MINPEKGIYFNPDLSVPIGSREPRRKRREARISDYLLPAPITELASPLPLVPIATPAHSLELMQTVMPYVDFRKLENGTPWPESFQHNYELLMIDGGKNSSQLVVQIGSKTVLARQVLDPSRQEELKAVLASRFPEEYANLVANIQPSDDPRRRVPEGWNGFLNVLTSKHDNEAFDLIHHLATHTTVGHIWIDGYEVSDSMSATTVNSERHSTTDTIRLHEERLIKHSFRCGPMEFSDGSRGILVGADIPWVGYERTGDKMWNGYFFVLEDGISIPEEEMQKMLATLKEEGRDLVAERQTDTARDYLHRWLKSQWDQHARNPITRREQRYRGPAAVDWDGPYVMDAFGKELIPEEGVLQRIKSVRVFEGDFEQPTVRDVADVAKEIYMTYEEVAATDSKQEAEDTQMKDWWVNKMLPLCREWDDAKVAEAVEYIRENARDPLALIADKLRGSTRLVVVGLSRHPLQDDLVGRMLQLPNIGFVAVEARSPGDKARALKEETLFTQVDLGEGIIMEVSQDKAKRKYPNRHRDRNKPQHFLDSVIARARVRDLDVIYALAGDTYKEVTANMGQRVAEYMTNHPGSKGILFTTLLHAIKWPGYETPEEGTAINSNRPFVDYYSLANAHYSDTQIRMPAYILHAAFPGEVYSLTQFEMPKGYGEEWRDLRSAVAALGNRQPFAIEDIAKSPFAEQWRILRLFPELESWAVEDLWQIIGPYCGPTKIDWGKLIHGVVVYPSDKELPRKQTHQEFLDKAGTVIKDVLDDLV